MSNTDFIDTLGSDSLALFSGNTYSANNTRAKELLKECRERDKDLVRVPHPTLPKIWLLVSREKQELLTQNNNGRMDKVT